MCNFVILVVFGDFILIKEEFFGLCIFIKFYMYFILFFYLNFLGGICFIEIIFKIFIEKKKINILVVKVRNFWLNIEIVLNF